jgi:hypothetical protein
MELCRDFFVGSVEALVVSFCQLMSTIFASFLLVLLSVVLSSVVANVAQDAPGYCLNGKAIDDVPKTGFEPASSSFEPDELTTAPHRVIGICLGRRGENW